MLPLIKDIDSKQLNLWENRLINSFANYHNVIRHMSYDEYNVEDLDYRNRDHKQLEKIMPTHIPLNFMITFLLKKFVNGTKDCNNARHFNSHAPDLMN